MVRACYTALYERCEALEADLPLEPTWWRSNRALMKNYKARMTDMLTSRDSLPNLKWFWWNTNKLAYGNFTNALDASAACAYVTPTQFCAELNLPSNFFARSYYRGRCGDGSFTNDTTVGRAHGFFIGTMGGNGYLPPGRTNFYTTDYDWGNMYYAITHMTRMGTENPAANDPNLAWRYDAYCDVGDVTDTWANAKLYLYNALEDDGNWTASGPVSFIYIAARVYDEEFGDNFGWGTYDQNNRFSLGTPITKTNCLRSSQWYCQSVGLSATYVDMLNFAASPGLYYVAYDLDASYAKTNWTPLVWTNTALFIPDSDPGDGEVLVEQELRRWFPVIRWDEEGGFSYTRITP